MRSRYSAYALNKADYLMQTWHADYRPQELTLDRDIVWVKLDIIDSSEQGDNASVEFEALLLVDGRIDALHENSRFVRQQGRWLYTTGEMLEPRNKPFKPGRNAPCPCGSGLKFKRCCGK
jgi:SEC-C motif-containing protein